LCEIPSITAVKEASGELSLFSKAAQLSGQVRYLSGDDFTFLPSLSVGGEGVISVVTNVFPKAFVKLYEHSKAGNSSMALEIHRTLYHFTELLFLESSPSPTKSVLAQIGLIEDSLRLPMVSVQPDTALKLKNSYQHTLNLLNELEAN
jgi:4-hydroxy-tetrahydrodipicolinate synthase